MNSYWLGVLTPFALIAGLALVAALVYLAFRAGDWLNSKTHEHMVLTIEVRKNRTNPLNSSDDRPEYFDKATQFRDALLKSPKMHLFKAFGRMVIVVRDYREVGR